MANNINNSSLDIWEAKYLKYKMKYNALKQKSQYVMHGGADIQEKKDKLYLFKADWCGHCKNFKSTWEKLQEDSELQNKVEFVTYDADKHSDKITNFGVEGFPTIILQKKDKVIEFNGMRDYDNVKNFVDSY